MRNVAPSMQKKRLLTAQSTRQKPLFSKGVLTKTLLCTVSEQAGKGTGEPEATQELRKLSWALSPLGPWGLLPHPRELRAAISELCGALAALVLSVPRMKMTAALSFHQGLLEGSGIREPGARTAEGPLNWKRKILSCPKVNYKG